MLPRVRASTSFLNLIVTSLNSPAIDPKLFEIVGSDKPTFLVIARAVTWSNGSTRNISIAAFMRSFCASAEGTIPRTFLALGSGGFLGFVTWIAF